MAASGDPQEKKKEGRVYHARSLHRYSALPCSKCCSCGPPIWDLHGQSQTQGEGNPLPYQASCSLDTQYNTLGCGGINLKLSCQVSSPILVLQAAEESAALYTWRAPYPIASPVNETPERDRQHLPRSWASPARLPLLLS